MAPSCTAPAGSPRNQVLRVGDKSLAVQAQQAHPLPAEMVATQQQMNDAQLVLQQRDYCAHYLIRLLKCKRDSFPNILACKHEQHDWDYCEHLDYVMRMKEFERERRLLQRKKRREQREADVARGQGAGEVAPEVAL